MKPLKHTSVYGKDGRPVWYAAYPDPNTGKRILRATEFRRDDPQGLRKAWNWVRVAAREGLLVLHENQNCNWAAWVEPWLRMKHQHEPHTLRTQLNWWSWLFVFLQERKIPTPRALSRDQVFAFIEWRTSQSKLNGKKVSFNSALQEARLLGRIMREAMYRGYAESNPCEKLGLKRKRAPEKSEITDEEVELIRARLERLDRPRPLADRWRSISFEVALHTGVRHHETGFPLDRVDWIANTIRLYDAKAKEFYTIPLHPGLRPLLEELRAAKMKVTCTLPASWQSGKFWSCFFKGKMKNGRRTKGFMPHLCFHSTRVTVITRFARAGVPVQQAMAYVHHANMIIHRIYQRLTSADVGRCVEALNFPRATQPTPIQLDAPPCNVATMLPNSPHLMHLDSLICT